MSRRRCSLAVLALVPLVAAAQFPVSDAPDPEGTGRALAAIDLTGYWVSVVTEDWKFRMVTPNRGVYAGIPLNAAGRRAADAWNPAANGANGQSCRLYGAAHVMRMPGRLAIAWDDDDTLVVETDAGSQRREIRFNVRTTPAGEQGWQGHSVAEWQPAEWQGGRATGGSLKVVTTHMRAGFLRANGVPYSDAATLTEYFNTMAAPNGDDWLVVTTIVEDPVYLTRPYVTSSNFKRTDTRRGWNPTRCD